LIAKLLNEISHLDSLYMHYFFRISFQINASTLRCQKRNASNLTLYLLNYTPHFREVKSHRKQPNRTTDTDRHKSSGPETKPKLA